MKRIDLKETTSTNEVAKSLRERGENLVVTALRQTGGKGTKGRSFSSAAGGVYLTRLTFYENFPAANAFLIMASASVAVCRTLEKYGFEAEIKWPNDVYVHGKKICGILIENTFSGNKISCSVVGIGLNVNNELPPELSETAISMRSAAGKFFDREEAENVLIEESGKIFPMEEYRKRIGVLGRPVLLLSGERKIPARAVDVDERGGLLAEVGGEMKRFAAAEVSLRFE